MRFNFTYNDDLIQVNAIASATLAAAAFTNQGMIPGTHYVVEVHAPVCGDANNPSCPYTSGGVVKIGLNSQQSTLMTHWKFMIAHELGHAVEWAFIGQHAINYNWGASAVCSCTHVANNPYSNTHCIQSRRDTGAGQIEGFAHAFAARVFNRDYENKGVSSITSPS
jgi:hypothetical protein